MASKRRNMFQKNKTQETTENGFGAWTPSPALKLTSKRRNMFYQNKKQDTTEIAERRELVSEPAVVHSRGQTRVSPAAKAGSRLDDFFLLFDSFFLSAKESKVVIPNPVFDLS
ncbi:hypothetical protein AAG570_000400 [Ranatra chinensis]|uniref:Uncharacterized protein n=1 Tax=Ranatra chinensis TaxID=642074 RepID=A0ABD0ZI50_9HEMI